MEENKDEIKKLRAYLIEQQGQGVRELTVSQGPYSKKFPIATILSWITADDILVVPDLRDSSVTQLTANLSKICEDFNRKSIQWKNPFVEQNSEPWRKRRKKN